VKPSNLAQRCALVVFPIPGEPVIMTARNAFVPFLPGFLNPDFRLTGLQKSNAMDTIFSEPMDIESAKVTRTSHVTTAVISRPGPCCHRCPSTTVGRILSSTAATTDQSSLSCSKASTVSPSQSTIESEENGQTSQHHSSLLFLSPPFSPFPSQLV
jgi:hypothetical protein